MIFAAVETRLTAAEENIQGEYPRQAQVVFQEILTAFIA